MANSLLSIEQIIQHQRHNGVWRLASFEQNVQNESMQKIQENSLDLKNSIELRSQQESEADNKFDKTVEMIDGEPFPVLGKWTQRAVSERLTELGQGKSWQEKVGGSKKGVEGIFSGEIGSGLLSGVLSR